MDLGLRFVVFNQVSGNHGLWETGFKNLLRTVNHKTTGYHNLTLASGDLNYNENITLNIYKINSITMNAGGNNNDGAIIEFVLSRGLQNIALNTYLPTGLLLAIAVATTWFKDDYFDSIIGVNLTLMLVLVTMFGSVSYWTR